MIDQQQGDGRSDLDQVFRSHYDAIYRYCLRRAGRRHAEDAAAEVFAVAWRRRNDMPRGERELAWLYGIAYRVVSHQWRADSRLRRLRQRIAGAGHDTPDDPAIQIIRSAEEHRVLAAAANLRPRDREILRLAGWEELPYAEIARVLEISVDAVAQRVSRAKRRLAAEFDRLEKHSTPRKQEGGRR